MKMINGFILNERGQFLRGFEFDEMNFGISFREVNLPPVKLETLAKAHKSGAFIHAHDMRQEDRLEILEELDRVNGVLSEAEDLAEAMAAPSVKKFKKTI